MKEAVEALANRISRRPEHFDRLFYKVDLGHLRDRALLLAPLEQVQAIHRDYLGDMRRLLALGPAAWHFLGLHNMLHEARERAARLRPGQPLAPSDERFFEQFDRVAAAARPCLAAPGH